MIRKSLVFLVLMLFIVGGSIAQNADVVTFTIINTSDEHGWLESYTPFGETAIVGGAANILAWWREKENYDPETTLLLSGGDNWTGPAISTWFKGEPMVEAFNLMGYDASAIGNHEFDFGRDVMGQRFGQADYPYLAANIRSTETDDLADFVTPYVLFGMSGVTVGVIGLTTQDTVITTNPANVGDLLFADYAETLREFVPQMRDEGADVIVALTHVCMDDLAQTAGQVPDLVDIMFAGHCNEYEIQHVGDVLIMGGGAYWRSYARVNVTYDRAQNAVVELDPALVTVSYEGDNPVEHDTAMTELVDQWRTQVDESLSMPIGYTVRGIRNRSDAMSDWVTSAWLWAYPSADVALTNWGGFRQDIEPGEITMGDIVGLMPFDDRLYDVEITGAQLAENLRCCGGAAGGLNYGVNASNVVIVLDDGREFDPDAVYHVLVNDFMYFGGDGYLFSQQDPDAYDTSIQWREPIIDYTLYLETSEGTPLEDYLNP